MLANHTKDLEKTVAISTLLKVWSELLTEYSELKFTFEKDRLPGIRGLARIASLYLPGRYLSGLWGACSLKWSPLGTKETSNDSVPGEMGTILVMGEYEGRCFEPW